MVTLISEDVAFHTESSTFYTVDGGTADFLRSIAGRQDLAEVEKEKLAQVEGHMDGDVTAPLFASHRDFLNRRKELGRLTVILTNACNFRCGYCYEGPSAGAKLNLSGTVSLSLPEAKRAIDEVFRNYSAVKTVMFFGGEPMLRFEAMKEITEYIQEKHKNGEHKETGFGIITNGSLYDPRKEDFLRKYGFHVTVSHDGPRECHDAWRMDHDGHGTYRTVSETAKSIRKAGLSCMIQATITPDHVSRGFGPLAMARFFRTEMGIGFAHVVPCQFGRDSANAWTPQQRDSLVSLYRDDDSKTLEDLERGNLDAVFLYSHIQSHLSRLVHKRPFIYTCPAGSELAISPEGRIFPCFMLADKEAFRLAEPGEEWRDAFWCRLHEFLSGNLKDRKAECKNCWCKYICHGCVGANYNVNGDILQPDPVNCAIMKETIRNTVVRLKEIRSDPQRWASFKKGSSEYMRKSRQFDKC